MTTFLSDSEHPHDVKAPPKSARRRAREFVLQGLYQWWRRRCRRGRHRSLRPEMDGFAKADREFFRRLAARRDRPAGKLVEQIAAPSTARSANCRRSKPA